ncbi:DNA-binding transcriptional LysR family regulator [Variovorax boronicumulans]|uniref:DNA-binding transcriptional LysR family regulator n=1 Tax=Variovorax boronicumulans TaxID=436515 RepID=A0AAW8D4S3_9BURK|nr:LysR substrate-binding domain-containing protein [Variovorax boronicumulans]MDP9896057.1 DNA-binding transcriptional LysR family regulator [Variovorax boronicumulans]MDQ0056097.1 DNA-binding transcriptional LysR family regulator [Variovorax boronicumulans]
MSQVMFDLDVLRSFSTGIALGSYARAADRLGRSTSAVSAQLKKLEAQAGTVLFRKAGRGLELTDAGETLLAYAHRMLELNEEASAAMRGADLEGWVRLGLQEDFGETLLPAVLGRFARAHPKVRIEACVARSAELRERLELGKLDLALAWDAGDQPPSLYAERVARLPLQWIGPASGDVLDAAWWKERERRDGAGRGARKSKEPLPLVLLDAPCPLRDIVTQTLDRAGVPWRHAFTSASLAALWAASSAGLGLTVRTPFGLPSHVRAIDRTAVGLPALPQMSMALYRAQANAEAPVGRLATLLLEAVRQHVQVAPVQMH